MQSTDTKRKPRCPRCGYDLRGVMSLWQESCPLIGKCSECGLDYEWSFVFHPEKYEPEWCVEYVNNSRKLFLAYFSTVFFLFMPWYFWRRIRMEFPRRFRKIIQLFVLLLFTSYFCLCISQGQAAKKDYKPIATRLTQYNNQMQKSNPNYKPLTLPSMWQVTCWAAIAPLSKYAGGPDVQQGTLFRGLAPLKPPRNMLQQHFSGWNTWHGLTIALKAIVFPIFLQILIALGFVLLPVSKRKAKVMPQHISHITLYGLIPCAIPLHYMWFTEHNGSGYISDLLQSESLGYLCFIILPLWLLLFWGFAISRHLRMRHAWGVAVAFFIIGYSLLLTPFYSFMFRHWPGIFL